MKIDVEGVFYPFYYITNYSTIEISREKDSLSKDLFDFNLVDGIDIIYRP